MPASEYYEDQLGSADSDYAEKVLEPAMDQATLARIKSLEAGGKTEEPEYMDLLMASHAGKLRHPGPFPL